MLDAEPFEIRAGDPEIPREVHQWPFPCGFVELSTCECFHRPLAVLNGVHDHVHR